MRNLQNPNSPEFPRAQVLPGPTDVRFLVDGREQADYQFGKGLPKPFVHPLRGPSGAELTRYGHPNPQSDHDHHRGIWFGHQFVRVLEKPTGSAKTEATTQAPRPPQEWNYWAEPGVSSDVRIRHSRVLALQDGADFAAATVEVLWWAGGRALLRQTTTYAIVPIDASHQALDVQVELASAGGHVVELGKSNFGLMGVRVAKTISEQFGGGRLQNSEGAVGEPAIFGKPARWVDYSGPTGPGRSEGICYMDHPSNPRHPSAWHVRRDGWMISSITLNDAWTIADGHPLTLRYRLLAHAGVADAPKLENAWRHFADTPAYRMDVPKGANPAVVRGVLTT